MTLDRALSRAGVASRTEAAHIIAAGRVRVDGRVVRDASLWVAPSRQRLELDGQPLERRQLLYLALHKPVGYITSHGDPEGRKTIYSLLGEAAPWVFPVGRLDRDTSGLLLLTNDSAFAERVTNPIQKVSKTYRVKVRPGLKDAGLQRLRDGLDIGRGEHTAPARVEVLRANERFCWVQIEIAEGKNRQVRRMIEALSHRVERLVRTRIGELELGTMHPGRYAAVPRPHHHARRSSPRRTAGLARGGGYARARHLHPGAGL
ncbi:MAG: pseudouridine synthase, partial [Terriglobales bacterium]